MKFRILCALLFGGTALYGQSSYFQQEVNYTIQVQLDESNKLLRGFEKMEYINRSPDTLQYIFMHLWPNAYKNDKTAFNKQQVENGKLDFYLSEKRDRGFIDSLSFTVNGKQVALSEYNNQPDVVMITLPEPLLPGKRIDISTPFRVVIPKVFSRLGFGKDNYQISQWYPKPAVYDRKGWHPMPYLDQGEFYSEYGRFDVSITVPANYVVAATGNVEQKNEMQFWEKRIPPADSAKASAFIKKIDTLYEVESNTKTLRFVEDNIHDFAWFASKKYLVDTATATLPSGKKVACYSYYLPKQYKLYKGSAQYTAKTVEYLSKKVGEYPYQQASVVDGTLLAGGGMEYPTITVIGNVGSAATLKTVILHEVGHNWFYGILGSNERDHPWMDEGMNSYYENNMDEAIAMNTKEASSSVGNALTISSNNNAMEKLTYLATATINLDQPCDAPSDSYLPINYGGVVYQKTAYMMAYLASYLGESTFDNVMQTYFSQWKFKHPYPEDFSAIAEQVSGKDLSWFFQDGLQSTKKIDFRLKQVKSIKANNTLEARVRSRTSFRGPVPVSLCQGDSILQTQWIAYPYKQNAVFPKGTMANKIAIDPNQELPEVNVANNAEKLTGLIRRRGIKPNVIGLGLGKHHQVGFLPAIGFNSHDGFELGLLMHNLRIPNRRFQFALAPQYGLESRALIGTGIVGYSFFPKNVFRKVTLAAQGNSYHHNEATLLDGKTKIFTRRITLSPSIRFDFKNKQLRNPVSNWLELRPSIILFQPLEYTKIQDSLFQPKLGDYRRYSLAEVLFVHKNARTFHPYTYQLLAEGNSEFAKIGFTGNFRIDYYGEGSKPRRNSFYFRAYAGKYFDLDNRGDLQSSRPQNLAATYTDINDYMYRDVFVNRNSQTGILSQQIAMREGGFKIRTNQFTTPVGMTNNWLAAVNMRMDVPVKLPFRLQGFADFGTFAGARNQNQSGSALLFDAGIEAHFFADALIIYCPLAMSRDFKDYTKSIYTKNRFVQTMSFSLNLSRLPFLHAQEKILESIKL
jgi:hypothetical protein